MTKATKEFLYIVVSSIQKFEYKHFTTTEKFVQFLAHKHQVQISEETLKLFMSFFTQIDEVPDKTRYYLGKVTI